MSAMFVTVVAVLLTQAAEPARQPQWNGGFGVSLISLTGNSESLTTSGVGTIEWKSEDWILAAKAAGAYGRSRASETRISEVVALNALAQARLDRRFSKTLSSYVLAGVDTDHLKSIEYRPFGELGASVIWLERQSGDDTTLFLRTDLAGRYAYESRFQYFPTPANLDDITLLAPKLGLSFRYKLNENISLSEDAEVLFNVLGDFRFLMTSTTKLGARLMQNLSLSVGFQVTHDSLPAAGKVPTDTALTVGVDLTF